MKIVFILYESRSGSTFLASELAKLTRVYVTPETHYVSKILEYPSHTIQDQSALSDIKSLLYLETHFLDLNIPENVFEKRMSKYSFPISKQDIIEEITHMVFSRTENFEDDAIVIIKHSPVKFISQLESIFDDVRFIHIIRDPRAIFASQKKSIATIGVPMSRNPFRTGRNWRRFLARRTEPKHCLPVKYEDLVCSKSTVLRQIAGFLGFTKAHMQESGYDYKMSIGSSQAHLHGNVSERPMQDKINKWQFELSSFEKWMVEVGAGSSMLDEGYEQVKHRHFFWKVLAFPFFLFFGYGTDLLIYWKVGKAYLIENPKMLLYKIKRKLS